MSLIMLCPCNSLIDYVSCCGKYIEGNLRPSSPLILMKSRYTAYTLGKIEYIQATMKGIPLQDFSLKKVKEWSLSVKWLNLNILKVDEKLHQIEFVAQYIEKNRIHQLHENSQFELIEQNWFYTNGMILQSEVRSIPLNSHCYCGSHRKFKNCHAIKK